MLSEAKHLVSISRFFATLRMTTRLGIVYFDDTGFTDLRLR